MTLEEILDKYRGAKPKIRYPLIFLIAVAIPLLWWQDKGGDTLEDRKAAVEAEFVAERTKFEEARQKAAELPALEAKLSDIDAELVKAKQFLPDRVEIDVILGFIGGLEKELDVTLEKFTPQAEVMGQSGLEYKELPVEIKMNGTFANTMRFMDRLVHMQNLSHIRNIQFDSPPMTAEEKKDTGAVGSVATRRVNSQARLILFKGL